MRPESDKSVSTPTQCHAITRFRDFCTTFQNLDMGIETLPPEILSRIIALLDFNSRVRLGLSCKSVHASLIAVLWSAPSIPSHPPESFSIASSEISRSNTWSRKPVPIVNELLNRYGRNVRSLTIPDLCESLLDLHALSLSYSLSGLYALDLSHCAPYTVGDNQVLSFLSNCPMLFSLCLDDCLNVSDYSLFAIARHPNAQHFHTISLRRCIEITDFGISTLVAALPRLSILNLRCIPSLSEDSIFAIAKHCQNIRSLDIADCDGSTDNTLAAIATGCTKLTSLDLSECMFVTPEGLVQFSNLRNSSIVQSPQPFENLKLNMLGHAICDESLTSLLPAPYSFNILPFTHSLTLEITDAHISAFFIKYLTNNYPNSFESLTLSKVLLSDIPDEVLPLDYIPDEVVQVFCDFLKCQTRVKYLNLSDSHYLVNDEICLCIANCLPMLESLDVSGCSFITDVGMVSIANKLKRLVDVNLKGCSQIGDASVTAFVNNQRMIRKEKRSSYLFPESTGIRVFNVGLCENVTDDGLKSLAGLFAGSGLSTLKVSGCFKITDQAIDYLYDTISGNTDEDLDHYMSDLTLEPDEDPSRIEGRDSLMHRRDSLIHRRDSQIKRRDSRMRPSSGKYLHLLCLSGCFNITDRSISRLIPLLSHLESLNVYACPAVTDMTVIALAENCPRLASLVLSKCSVGDKGAMALSVGCQRLHTLYVAYLLPVNGQVGLGDEAIAAILSRCRQLKLLDISRNDVVTDRPFANAGQVSMQVLILKACPRLRVQGLLEFVNHARRVQSVDVTGCVGMTLKEKEMLRECIDEKSF
ncbi:hypothetical protein HK098_002538 [Nowakowskiella sp. JEL0407]|nr:hypothetical protein HK098_002538 [Nowakowskiella sp. JEL0407]